METEWINVGAVYRNSSFEVIKLEDPLNDRVIHGVRNIKHPRDGFVWMGELVKAVETADKLHEELGDGKHERSKMD